MPPSLSEDTRHWLRHLPFDLVPALLVDAGDVAVAIMVLRDNEVDPNEIVVVDDDH